MNVAESLILNRVLLRQSLKIDISGSVDGFSIYAAVVARRRRLREFAWRMVTVTMMMMNTRREKKKKRKKKKKKGRSPKMQTTR